jgi:hypothetical protein
MKSRKKLTSFFEIEIDKYGRDGQEKNVEQKVC